MPKAILEFTLPEEQCEFRTAHQAGALRSACWEYANWLRSNIKYAEKRNARIKALEEAQTQFYEFLNERGIDLFSDG